MKITAAHRAILANYCEGEFMHLIEPTAESHLDFMDDEALRNCGDLLLIFMMTELDPDQGCGSVDEGVNRLQLGIADLQVALEALYQISEALDAKVAEEIQQRAAVASHA